MYHALLVYPKFPPSYWGYTYALDFVGKKAVMPPLGLLTVAAMFPAPDWHLKVVDMNVQPLTDTDLAWADDVFTSTMLVQKHSFYEVVKRCNQHNIPVIAGGAPPDVVSRGDHPRGGRPRLARPQRGSRAHFSGFSA